MFWDQSAYFGTPACVQYTLRECLSCLYVDGAEEGGLKVDSSQKNICLKEIMADLAKSVWIFGRIKSFSVVSEV